MNQQRNAPPQQAIVLGSKQNLQTLLAKPNVGLTIERVATKWLSAEQIKTQAAIAVSRNPGLLKCTQASFLESMVRAAELGLRFAGAGGEAYLVPYKSRCTLIIGYRGLCALARRTGIVTRIEARVVHEKDVFEVGYGTGQTLVHRPHLGADRGEIIAAYAVAELRDSDDQIEVMTRAELDLVRKRSPSGSDGPWVSDFAEMCRKTVLRRLCKYLPFATAFEDALAAEDALDHDSPADQEPPRRYVETQVVPEGVDPETGEILGDAGQAYLPDVGERGPAGVADDLTGAAPGGDQGLPGVGGQPNDFAAQKRSLLAQIQDEMNVRYPDDGSIARQTARLDVLSHVFGSPDPNKIGHLPLEVLKAGLAYLKSQANQETQG
jgi:recombination protein RecT